VLLAVSYLLSVWISVEVKWPANVESDLQSLSPEAWMQLSVERKHEPHW
jgi:hypothetical protein